MLFLVFIKLFFLITISNVYLACKQAPGGASAEQTFGAKRRQ